jgi:hypothetical protein
MIRNGFLNAQSLYVIDQLSVAYPDFCVNTPIACPIEGLSIEATNQLF